MAYAAVQQRVSLEAVGLWLGNVALSLAYDTEYAMVDRDDDLKIGMKTSAITLGLADVAGVTAFYLMYWALWLWLCLRHTAGWALALGFAAALAQIAWHYTLIRERTRQGCFVAFSQSHWLSFAVTAGIAVSLALG
jgi:4-hydroxybenzoate polyprenyltransferase